MSIGTSLLYTVSDAARNIRENLITALLSALTVAFSLAIFALFVIVFVNLNSVVSSWGEQTHVVAYVKDSAIKSGSKALGNSVLKVEGVRKAAFISKEEALESLRRGLKGNSSVLEGVEGNPLPASFEIQLEPEYRSPEGIEAVVDELGKLKWVDDLQYGGEWVEKFSAFVNFMELTALLIGLFLAAATLFIISNTVRLTVYARKDEIEVMRLVGASELYVKTPFFIEGMVAGFVGGVVAFVMLIAVRLLLSIYIPPYFGFVLDNPFSSLSLLIALIFAGIVIGGTGSLVSLGRFLKV